MILLLATLALGADDLYGDPLPEGAVSRLGTSRLRHGAFTAVDWSADGQHLVSQGFYGEIVPWDARTGTPLPPLLPVLEGQGGLDVQGSRVLASDSSWVRAWDLGGSLLWERQLPQDDGYGAAVAWSLDGRRAAVARCGVERGAAVQILDGGTGSLVASVHAERDEISGECVEAPAWTPAGTLLLASEEKLVAVDRSGGRLWTREVDQVATHALAVSPDGRLVASGGTDDAVNLWELSSGRAVRSFGWLGPWVDGLAWSPDGEHVAALVGSEVRVWSVSSGAELARFAGTSGHADGLAFSPDGRQLAWTREDPDGIVLVDTRTWQPTQPPEQPWHGQSVVSTAWSADGKRVITGSVDGTARVWRASTGEQLAVLGLGARSDGATANGVQVGWSPRDELVATGGRDGVVRLWSPDGELLHELEGMGAGMVGALVFSPDGRHLAALRPEWSEPSRVWVWEVHSRELVSQVQMERRVDDLAWSPDGRDLAAAGCDLWRWSPGQGEPVQSELRGCARALDWGRHGLVLATGEGLWLRHPDETEGQRISGARLSDVQWSPDGEQVAGAGKDLRIWPARGGEPRVYEGGHEGLSELSWSPDGERVVVGGYEPWALVWEVGP